ncbi:hypothetical protein EDD53_1977 [Pacificibacter maritimus]|uniref:Uncharacterized protein n=1 Tax=Pacificibacter maritimus TaxID=762213 RepID=A0A3N4UMJ3_9RHOB|nr:hypothetical protein [Pacificibacter maritimus]RPE66277.1 hypothetical protein EDD53_1977 [Pacificibacter maritimus]
MTAALAIKNAPYRSVWIFKIDLNDDEIDTFSHEVIEEDNHIWPLGTALGINPFPDHDFVEVLDLDALRSYGFANYLIEANGLDLGEDAQKLDDLSGHILLVFSQAVESGQTEFAPTAPLSFVGRYHQAIDTRQVEPMVSLAAKGQLPQGKPVKSDARIGGMVATFVLIFLAIFVTVFVWIGG